MILKYILLGTLCWNFPDTGTQCSQYLVDDLSDGAICKESALAEGTHNKPKNKELGGSMEEYNVHCMAIDKEGYNVDESFRISYTIL